MKQYDVVVAGLGIMGAAAAWRASSLGAKVLALEKGGPTHRGGSSHGATRIFRQAYWEGESYLELLKLADEGWRELQKISETRLLVEGGGLFIGPRKTGVVAGSLSTARHGRIAHEHLDALGIRQKFPQFAVDDDMEGVFEPGAYAVLAEDARLQMLNATVAQGGEVIYGEAVEAIRSDGDHPVIVTRSGRSLRAGSVLVCAGGASSALVPELSAVVRPMRVPIFWFKPKPNLQASFTEDRFPVFLYEARDGALLYGIASGLSAERGVKVGFHNRQHVPFSPNSKPPSLEGYTKEIATYISAIFPDLVPGAIDGKWCIYSMTPDESFVLDVTAAHRRVFYASVCSGHGFKFAPAIGQVLAEQGLDLRLSANVDAFRMARFG